MPDYRPKYHVSPATGWLNDPNGLVFYEGEYHLFYQWCELLDVDVTKMQWAHAVSKDLVHWEHLPLALSPDSLGAVWSGSAVADTQNTSGLFKTSNNSGGLVAAFTLYKRGVQGNPDKSCERQGIAFSSDRGRTWTKYAGNPLFGDENSKDVRDPKVFWHAPTRRWIMIIGVEQQLFGSPNLKDWTYLSHTGFKSECPDLFPVRIENEPGSKWVVSLGGTDCCIGEFDGEKFHAESAPMRVDHGADFYASQSWDGIPDLRRVWTAWLCRWEYAGKVPDFGARGVLSIPRELLLRRQSDGTLRLIQRPVPELAALRKERLAIDAKLSQPNELFRGDAFEFSATLRPAAGDVCGIKVLGNASSGTLIGYDAKEGCVFVDREHSGNAVITGRYATRMPLRNGSVLMTVFVDRCSVEVFFNDGDAVFSNLVFPLDNSSGVYWTTATGTSSAEDVAAYLY
jgi:fructan beta-fructosidase